MRAEHGLVRRSEQRGSTMNGVGAAFRGFGVLS